MFFEKIMKSGVLLLTASCVLVGMWVGNSSLLGQEKFGSLNGTVTDPTGAVLPGVTVSVTNKTTNRSRTVVTNSDGTYTFNNLEPGAYSLKFELSGFSTVNVPDRPLQVGQTIRVDAGMKVGAVVAEVEVTDVVPLIDMQGTLLAHNVTQEEFDRTPKQRTFQSLALSSPGVNSGDIEGGFQIHGASGAENSFIVDGVVTTSPLEGQSRQNTVFEYLQEVQVKTGGIDAEYGGALGGVISAITKSGGAQFHGEGHYYYSGNAISAGPVQRLQLSPIDATTIYHLQDPKAPLKRHEPGGSVGGPILKDKVFFFGSFSPQIVRRSNSFMFSNGTEPGTITKRQTNYQGFGKLTYASRKINANFSTLVTPTRDIGKIPAYNGTGANFAVGSLNSFRFNQGTGYSQNQYNLSANLDYTVSAKSLVSLRGGYFSDNYVDTGISTTTSWTYQITSVGLADIPAAFQGPVNTQNLPRTIITFIDKTRSPFVNLDYTQTFNAMGTHVLKGGAGARRTINDVNKTYPGGYVFIYWDQSLKGADGVTDKGTYGYYSVNDFGTRGKVGANIVSLYVQDTWRIHPRLTLNLGLRTENEKLPTFRPDIAKYAFQFGFGDKLAPRLGAAYDLHGDGKIKLSGSWGRYYDWTKYELSRGSFGGDFWHVFYRSLDSLPSDPSGLNLNINNMPGRDLWRSPTGFRDLRSTSIQNTDPNIKPMYQDDINAGVDFQLSSTNVLGVHYVHNNLGRTIEDFSALINGDNVYRIGNPGEGTSLIYPASYAPTANFPMPKPQRQYDALELTFSRRFAERWFLNANYTFSRLYGNYPGLANSDEIDTPTTGFSAGTTQQQAGSIGRPGSNSNSAYDTDTLLWDSHGHLNVVGKLPTDRPNVFKLYGSYSFPTGTQIGGFLYAGNGTPISTQVNSLDQEGLFVNGRGDLGRTPALSHTDLMLSHEIKTGESAKLRFELNVLNVFNQKTPTHIFNFLNKGAPGQSSTIPADAIDMSKVNLAAGYDYKALLSQTTDQQSGISPYDNRYKLPDLWNSGLAGQFLIKFIF
jgi:hypothetical protein